jgi:hypothetical protein
MKTHLLFPNKYKALGWILFIPSILLVMLSSIFDFQLNEFFNVKVFALYNDDFFKTGKDSSFFQIINNNISDEILSFTLIIGGLLIGFSKLKVEDEMISKIRYESLVWATYLNYALFLLFTLLVYGISFLNVLFYNTFTLLLFFIIRFHYMIYKLNKANKDDE